MLPRLFPGLGQGEYLDRRNLILIGNRGGSPIWPRPQGLLACRQGKKVRFQTPAGLNNHLSEAQTGLRLSHLEKSLAQMDLLVIDEVSHVPFSENGFQLLFRLVAQGYERQFLIMTINLEFPSGSRCPAANSSLGP